MKILILLLLQIFTINSWAEICYQGPLDFDQIHSLAKEMNTVSDKVDPPLLGIESEIGNGRLNLNLDQNGNILGLNIKSDFVSEANISVRNLNEGKYISMFESSKKTPFLIEKHKKDNFDSMKGGKLNIKVLESRGPFIPLYGSIARSYRNYTVEIKKVNNQWKIFFDDKAITRVNLYPRYSSWGWDEVFAGANFE